MVHPYTYSVLLKRTRRSLLIIIGPVSLSTTFRNPMVVLRRGLAAALLLVCTASLCRGEETAAVLPFGRPIITSFSGKLYDFVGRPDAFFDLVSCETHQVRSGAQSCSLWASGAPTSPTCEHGPYLIAERRMAVAGDYEADGQ